MFCSLSSVFYSIGDKIDADCFKYEIIPLVKANDRIKFDQDVTLNHVREKVKPRCKLLYKLFKEENVYDILLEVSPYPILIQLKYFLVRIDNCITVVGSWVFTVNFLFHFLSLKTTCTTIALIYEKGD